MKKVFKRGLAWIAVITIVFSTVPLSHAQEKTAESEMLVQSENEDIQEEDTIQGDQDQEEQNTADDEEQEEEQNESGDKKSQEQNVVEEAEQPDLQINQEPAEQKKAEEENAAELFYRSHVQNFGWQSWKKSGEMSGTSGQSRRMEALQMKINDQKYMGSIEYQTHIQNLGWQGWRKDGQTSGTEGKSLRMEAVRIRLTGELAEQYDIYYRAYVQNYGWLPYVKNGEPAGSEGFDLRMEGIEVKLEKKDSETSVITGYGFLKNVLYYSGHIQLTGDVREMKSGNTLGTIGQSKRMEALALRLKGMDGYASGSVKYQTHIQNLGWQGWKQNGNMAGTTGKSLRLEAVRIHLEGEIAQIYDVYYRVHVQNYGWLGWTKNGEESGTIGYGYRMEAIQICLVPKGVKAPGATLHSFLKKYTDSELTYSGHVQNTGNVAAVKGGSTLGTVGKGRRLEGFSINLDDSAEGLFKGGIQYRAHVQDLGWQSWKQEGNLAGTTGQGKRMEAIQIRLTGEIASYYHIYYRVHSQYFGWLGWAKDGESAGTSSLSLRIEAIQVKLVLKADSQSTYQTGKAYYNTYKYQNPKQYLQIRHVQKTLSGGGYNLSSGYMGLKVWYVQKKLGLSGRRAIMDSTTVNAVRNYQRKNGLPATGVVNLSTWEKMGYSESAWYNLGAYASPLKTTPASTRQDCIEAMISTAYQYLGNPYIIGASGDSNHGLDCSGLVMQALYSAGIDPAPVSPIRHSMPGYEYECRNLWNLPMKHVSYSQRQRGDLIFYKNSNGVIIHVAIYLGNNQVIESWPNKVVIWPVQNSHRSLIAGVARPFV